MIKRAKLEGVGQIELNTDTGEASVTIYQEGLPELKKLLRRALNTMPDISKSILTLSDFLDSHLDTPKQG